jgi:hypothetical protein
VELARGQGSPSLELRTALSLARQLRIEGPDDMARGLTAGVYSTFTAGFETHDLRRHASCWPSPDLDAVCDLAAETAHRTVRASGGDGFEPTIEANPPSRRAPAAPDSSVGPPLPQTEYEHQCVPFSQIRASKEWRG